MNEPTHPTGGVGAVAQARPPFPDLAARQGDIRPHRKLLTYYGMSSLMLGPFFLFLLIPNYLRYRTLRFHFDEDGVSMRWGVLYRREISLNYARIQDIHLTSNVVERWMGLARIQIQTASGNSDAEMTIEGLLEYEGVRDFLYSRMRGARADARPGGGPRVGRPKSADETSEVAATLREVAAELRALRASVDRRGPDGVSADA